MDETIQVSFQFTSLEMGAYCESWLKQQLRQAHDYHKLMISSCHIPLNLTVFAVDNFA